MDRKRLIRIEGLGPVARPDIPTDVLRMDYVSGVDGLHDWAMVRAPKDDVSPLVVVLHGHGSHGDQLWVREDLRRLRWPFFEQSACALLSPNLRNNAWMGPVAASDLRGLIDAMLVEYGRRPVVLAGGSMGGTGALIYAALNPEDVAGVVALCPATDIAAYRRWCRSGTHDKPVAIEIAEAIEASYGGSPEGLPEDCADHRVLPNAGRLSMPVYLAHGDADPLIPFEQSTQLVERLAGRDDVMFVPIPGGGHDAPIGKMLEGYAWVVEKIG